MTVGILRTGGFVLNVATNYILKNQKLNIVRTVAQRWRVIKMTIEEIKSQLEDLIRDRESFMVGDYDKDIYDRDKEALEFAVKAVEKQIPKKLIHKTTRFVIQGFELDDDCIYCPLCNKFIGNLSAEPDFNRISDYCPDCGQALDWGGEDE